MRSNKSLVVLSLTTAGIMFSAGVGFAAEKGTVTADSLNIRKGPGTGYTIIDKASKNTKVDILESKNGWYKVQLPNGVVGWGSGAYIDTTIAATSSTTSTGKITVATYLRDKESWSANKLELLKEDTKVEVISKGANWTKAKYNGKTGYIGNDYIEIVASGSNNTGNANTSTSTNSVSTGKITVATYLRDKESWSANKLELLNEGAKVEVISKGASWTKAKYNGKTGYIGNDYIEIVASGNNTNTNNNTGNTNTSTGTSSVSTGKITVATYLRDKESWSANKLELLNEGTKVEVISKGASWTKAKYNGKTGYIGNDYIEIVASGNNNTNNDSSNNTSTDTSKVNTGKITVATYLRDKESWSANKLELLNEGTKVEVISKGANWTKVKYNGKIGYIGNDYIEVVVSGNNNSNNGGSESTTRGTVNTSSLNVRTGPGTSYDIKTKITLGQQVVIKSEKNGWYNITTANGIDGWVSKSYIDIIIEDSMSPEDMDEKIQAVIKVAKAQLGKPYVWGAEGPDSFDCSGLMWYVYKKGANIDLPRVSRDQAKAGRAVSLNELLPGDLVYFDSSKDGVVNHIGMYIGNGQWIHAPRSGDVVKIASVNDSYYKNNAIGARRIIG